MLPGSILGTQETTENQLYGAEASHILGMACWCRSLVHIASHLLRTALHAEILRDKFSPDIRKSQGHFAGGIYLPSTQRLKCRGRTL